MRKLISHQQEEDEEQVRSMSETRYGKIERMPTKFHSTPLQSAVLQRLREEELYRKEREKAQEEEIVRLRVLKENAKGNDFEMQVSGRVKSRM